MMKISATIVLFAAQILAVTAGQTPQPSPSSIFTIETGEFWLNLHHFLYVLGRAEAKARDASRAAVVDAPAEAQRVLETLSAEERQTWTDAVPAYASGLSGKDPIFDERLAAMAGALAASATQPHCQGLPSSRPLEWSSSARHRSTERRGGPRH